MMFLTVVCWIMFATASAALFAVVVLSVFPTAKQREAARVYEILGLPDPYAFDMRKVFILFLVWLSSGTFIFW